MRLCGRLSLLALVTIAGLFAVGCSAGGGSSDKAGGSGGSVALRLANTNGDIGYTPAVEHFVKRVEELSGGDVRIEVENDWGGLDSDAEQRVVRGVSSGAVDLGWVGTRVFDTLGVESFQALTAPMLIDSYALEDAVIESGITEQMMGGVDELGVVGLGVLPDGLRKPIGVTAPIVAAADWRGIRFGTLPSKGQVDAIRALGGRPAQVGREERETRLGNGRLDGFETSIWIHQRNPALVHLAPYVAANVSLWPQMNVLIANPDRLEKLSAAQRGWLDEAARDAAAQSDALADKDAGALVNSCAAGARFAEASAEDLAALQARFGSVYAALRRHPETRAYIERIHALKKSTVAEPRVSIPSDCTGRAPRVATGGAGPAPAYLNGTYRYVLTQADADAVGDPEKGYPIVNTIELKDGRLKGGCFGAQGGTYSVVKDRITFHSIEYDEKSTVRFAVDDSGSLDLTPVPPIDPGAAFTCFYKPWTRIDETNVGKQPPRAQRSASINGTYRYVLTRADARAAVPDAEDLDSYPHIETWTLKDGRYSNPGGLEGSYSLDGNRITFDVPDFGYALRFTFSVDHAGNLRLTPARPMNRGDRFVWSYKLWRKID
jgi:TRAP-type C4-dicarboxylate transport system substrate-binding protein